MSASCRCRVSMLFRWRGSHTFISVQSNQNDNVYLTTCTAQDSAMLLACRHGINEIFYTIKIRNIFNLSREKRVNRAIFGPKFWMNDVFLIYFDQIISFLAIIFSNTNSLKLFCENSSLNSTNFTDNVISRVNSWKFYPSRTIIYTSDKFHVCGAIFRRPILLSKCTKT